MLHKTKGIILRTVRYGETSLVVTAYTELFGMQTYLVKGVRQNTKKTGGKANAFQPAALLDMVVYHNELKQLQIIREYKWNFLYRNIYSDVIKNCVALFIAELVTKSIKQPENNPELFEYIESYLVLLDEADAPVIANLPLHFALHFARQLGFGIENNQGDNKVLDLREGIFTHSIPAHSFYMDGRQASATAELLAVEQAVSLFRIKLNKQLRQQLLSVYEQFYLYHISDFGNLKSLPVLEAILS